MPRVAPYLDLRDELLALRRERNWSEAELGRQIGLNSMTLNRFLKHGRAIPGTIAMIRHGLGTITGAEVPEGLGAEGINITVSTHVISALEYLLAASREKARKEA
jgi:hypothetical protein